MTINMTRFERIYREVFVEVSQLTGQRMQTVNPFDTLEGIKVDSQKREKLRTNLEKNFKTSFPDIFTKDNTLCDILSGAAISYIFPKVTKVIGRIRKYSSDDILMQHLIVDDLCIDDLLALETAITKAFSKDFRGKFKLTIQRDTRVGNIVYTICEYLKRIYLHDNTLGTQIH